MEYMLGLFLLVLPKGHCLPDSMDKIKKVVRDLVLNYEKIDACYNDCVLFRGKEYEGLDNCPKCSETRWKQSKEVPDVGSSCDSKSAAHVKCYGTSHLFHGSEGYICQRIEHRICVGIRKNWWLMEKCDILRTPKYGNMWMQHMNGLQRILVMSGLV